MGRLDTVKHRVEFVVKTPCKKEIVYKCSLEMQTSANEWIEVLENVRHRVNPPYGFSTPLVSSPKRRETLVIPYPSALPKQYATNRFRIKAQYVEYSTTNRRPAPHHELYTAAFRF